MTKLLVETTGPFELVDYSEGMTIIAHDRPSVATNSTFVQSRTALGQIRVLDNLTDEATDEEYAKYLKDSDGDQELALSAFKSAYSQSNNSTTSKPSPEPEVKRGPKPKVTSE